MFFVWVCEIDDVRTLYLNDSFISLVYDGENYKSKTFFEDVDWILFTLKELSVDTVTSISLRYINEIVPKFKIENWRDWINTELYPHNFHPKNSKITRSLTRTDYKFDDFNLIFQFGQYNLNYPSDIIQDDFILDYECFSEKSWEINDVKDMLYIMDETIYEFFIESIAKNLKNKFGV